MGQAARRRGHQARGPTPNSSALDTRSLLSRNQGTTSRRASSQQPPTSAHVLWYSQRYQVPGVNPPGRIRAEPSSLKLNEPVGCATSLAYSTAVPGSGGHKRWPGMMRSWRSALEAARKA